LKIIVEFLSVTLWRRSACKIGPGRSEVLRAEDRGWVVSDVDRVERFRLTWDFSTTFRRRRHLRFQFRLQIFGRRVGIFSK